MNTFSLIIISNILLILYLPRKYSFAPLLIMPLYLTISQKIIILSLDLNGIRILYLFYWLKIILKNEYSKFKFNNLDKSIILWLISLFILNNILWKFSHLIYNFGFLYDVIGSYFIFRILIRNIDDIRRIILFISISIIPLGIFMLLESIKGLDIYSVYDDTKAIYRHNKVRAKGPFLSPILAGTFAATILPLLIYPLLIKYKNKTLYVIAFIACCLIVYSTLSSGPLLALIFGLFGLFSWHYKNYIKDLLLISFVCFILISIIMKAPIWFLYARISSLIGQGGGYHRAFLVQQFIRYHNEWLLYGTNNTAHWMPYTLAINPNMVDITNHYIVQAIRGGIIPFILFFNILFQTFKLLKNSFKLISNENNTIKLIFWCSGVSLSTHLLSFLSVSYFDQIEIYWFLLLAIISTLTNPRFVKNTQNTL